MAAGARFTGYGPGETLTRWKQELRNLAPEPIPESGPLRLPTRDIPANWIGHDGRVTESRYFQLIGDANDTLLRSIGVDDKYRSRYGGYQTLETHMRNLGGLRSGDSAEVLTQVLGADDRILHLFHAIKREGDEAPAATSEQVLLHIAAGSGRSEPAQGNVRERVIQLAHQHADLPRPERTRAKLGSGEQIQQPLLMREFGWRS
ncbi:thioesterase family protein [Bradyrhizobium yuanmingense]|uniref:thioesterase family protein n=1 Tax=Bradyrhizobium yuanmingense TaxID=108015 RepID=UPI0034DEC936